MSALSTIFEQSALALAAYAKNLFAGISGDPYLSALEDSGDGMSVKQAIDFAETYEVLDQYTDPITGASATIFRNTTTNELTVAIRGTEASIADILADAVLAAGVPAKLNQQYQALTTQMDAWLADSAKLSGKTFTVTGHSLGGYLAEAIKEAYPAATAAYLYNAPGTGGLIGNFTDLVAALFNQSAPGANNTWNIKGSEGASFITGLGGQPSGSIPIQIEADPSLGFDNHSIVRLVDALAIQSLYATLNPNLTQDQLNALIDASGTDANDILECALDAVRKLLLGPATGKTSTNRNATDGTDLFSNLDTLKKSQSYKDLLGKAKIVPLTGSDTDSLIGKAQQTDAEGLAYRYALVALNPFVVLGADYTSLNADGALDLYDPATHAGEITDQYLTDRAEFLVRKTWFNTNDLPAVKRTLEEKDSHLYQKDDTYFVDEASGYQIAQGFDPASPFANIHRYCFGDDQANALTGGGVSDHLYGGGSLDVLTCSRGNDYLEGVVVGRVKWRSSAQATGEAISMRLPETALPRSSLHAASGQAPNQPASAGETHDAQNNSLWEIAA